MLVGGLLERERERAMEVAASSDDKSKVAERRSHFQTTRRSEGGRRWYFISGFALVRSQKDARVCACDLHEKSSGVRRAVKALCWVGKVSMGQTRVCGVPGMQLWAGNLMAALTRPPFPLAVSSPDTPKALVAAANDTTPPLAIKKTPFDSAWR